MDISLVKILLLWTCLMENFQCDQHFNYKSVICNNNLYKKWMLVHPTIKL